MGRTRKTKNSKTAKKPEFPRAIKAKKEPAKAKLNPGKIRQIGRVSSASVQKHTGKNWDQWIAILDRANARDWPHREITMLLKKQYKLSPWWQQGVAIAYELHHGKRVEGRNLKGEYSTVATKTLPVSTKNAWKILTSESGMASWLKPFSPFSWAPGQSFEVDGGIFGEIRTLKPGVRARLTWQEAHWAKPSVVQIHLVPRKGDKCMLVIQHERIPSANLKGKLREQWKEALKNFSAAL